MSSTPASSVLERRGTIRNRARAGEDPRAIALDLRIGTRTVLGVLAMPETDLERDAADLLAGWSPDCMDAPDWTHWQRMNPGNVGGGKALKPCWDCPLEFAVEMRAIDRCNGSPGRPVGRPVSRPVALAPLPIAVRPPPAPSMSAPVSRPALVTTPPEEPVMPDAAPNPLTTLSEAAETAADAHRAKLLADEAWEEARSALTAAWSDVGALVAPADPVEALGELVEVAGRAIGAGVAAEAESPVLTFGFRKRSPGKAQEAREKADRAARVMAAMTRHGGDKGKVAAELGMKANAVAMVVKHALAREARDGR